VLKLKKLKKFFSHIYQQEQHLQQWQQLIKINLTQKFSLNLPSTSISLCII